MGSLDVAWRRLLLCAAADSGQGTSKLCGLEAAPRPISPVVPVAAPFRVASII